MLTSQKASLTLKIPQMEPGKIKGTVQQFTGFHKENVPEINNMMLSAETRCN